MAKKTRVLVVDDSALMREMITDAINETSDLEVIGKASDGHQAVVAFRELRPELVTLDVQMPGMDGLATLEALLQIAPVPVIMVSALTQLGAETTFNALDRGALDYIGKPAGGNLRSAWKDELLRKIRQMAGCDVQRLLNIRRSRAERRTVASPAAKLPPSNAASPGLTKAFTSTRQAAEQSLAECCIAIGISTGGPPALTSLFESITGPLPPIVIVQHMPADFTKPFAWRLNSISSLSIKEAATGDILLPNSVYIAPGGMHLTLNKSGGFVRCRVKDGDPVSSHKPSVDVMMKSAAEIFGQKCLGVIMTGMGRDGADGCRDIRAAGGYVLGQDEASSDVYGMNKVAFVSGHVDKQFSLEAAAAQITQQARRIASLVATPAPIAGKKACLA